MRTAPVPGAAAAADSGSETGKKAQGEIRAASNLARAKALIDEMTVQLEKMVGEVEAAGADAAKVKAIGEKFKQSADSMKAKGELLSRQLTEDEKKVVEAYGREKMTPLMGRLMAAMQKNQPNTP